MPISAFQLLSDALRNAQVELATIFLGIPARPSPVRIQHQPLVFSREILRWNDLLSMRLDFYNLRLDEASQQLRQVDASGDCFIAATFSGQHVAEQAYEETSSEPPGPPPVGARLAGESRLVLHVDAAELPLDWTLQNVLDLLGRSAPLVTDRTTAPVPSPAPGQLARFGADEKSLSSLIEFPWRVLLSPGPDARWAHDSRQSPAGGDAWIDELWHTRLAVADASAPDGISERPDPGRTVRVVHSPDHAAINEGLNDPQVPFLNSLKRRERAQLLELCGNRRLAGNAPVAAHHLMLTALGANAHLHGSWSTSLSLVDWIHRAWLGRDHFVQVTHKGWLMPFGHRAVKIAITERKLDVARHERRALANEQATDGAIAYLRRREFIVVREPRKQYAHGDLPFRSVRINTLVTPDLAPSPYELLGGNGFAFWIQVPNEDGNGKNDFLFSFTGLDWLDNEVRFDAPLAFVEDHEDADPHVLAEAYNEAGPDRRNRVLNGQPVAFAPSRAPGDTRLECSTLQLRALKAERLEPSHTTSWQLSREVPIVLPAMQEATVVVPAVRDLTGGDGLRWIALEPGYVAGINAQARAAITGGANGFSGVIANSAEVFAKVLPGPRTGLNPLDSGGLAAPNFEPQGLSRSHGAVGDLPGLLGQGTGDDTTPRFNPAKALDGIRILGGISLGAIIKSIPMGNVAQLRDHLPGLTQTRTTQGIETRYLWKVTPPYLQGERIDDGAGGTKPGSFNPKAGACTFELESSVLAPFGGGEPTIKSEGRLTNFMVTLPPGEGALISAGFRMIKFSAGSGKKMDVSVDFEGLKFTGALSFIEKLREYIPIDGFIDPPYVDVGKDAITAGYTLAIPSTGVGVFVLGNLSLSAGFVLPYVNDPAALRFAFCERHQPFMLTVMGIGGGGFAAVELELGRVVNVEVAMEFGAAVAINLGVASGQVSVMGGTYMTLSSEKGFMLQGYFRLNGSMSVLGLVSLSIQIMISLTFQAKVGNGRSSLTGEASVEVKVEILFFSKTVRVAMKREFIGSDPSFKETVERPHWQAYCKAFAND